MRQYAKALAVLALASLFVSGCMDASKLEVSSSLASIPRFSGYTWTAPYVTDANGTITKTLSASPDGTLPHYVQQLLPREGGDASLHVDQKGEILFASFDWVVRSQDAGQTWLHSADFKSPNYPNPPDRFLTMGQNLWTDDRYSVSFWGQLNRDGCIQLARSIDGGRSWTNGTTLSWPVSCVQPSGVVGFAARHYVFTGSAVPIAGLVPAPPPFPYQVYWCQSQSLPVVAVACFSSRDAGESWSSGVPVIDVYDPQCQPQMIGHPGVYADGSVALPTSSWMGVISGPCSLRERVGVFLSSDGGLTWSLRALMKGPEAGPGEPVLKVDSQGVGHLVYLGSDQAVYYARSGDRFATWEGPFRVSSAHLTITTHPTIVVGDDGRVAIGYLGTSREQAEPVSAGGASASTPWHHFVSHIGGALVSENEVLTMQTTPIEDPVQVGCIRLPYLSGLLGTDSGDPIEGCQNLMSRASGDIDPSGRVYFAVPDACVIRNGCTADTWSGFQARERQPSIVVLDSGLGLMGSQPLPSLGMIHPLPPDPVRDANPQRP
jgi:hypothetical protein